MYGVGVLATHNRRSSNVAPTRMTGHRTRAFVLLVFAPSLLAACSKDTPKSTRWDDAAAQGNGAPAPIASVGPVAAGGGLNAAFPGDSDGFTRVFTQEKDGFAEAKWQKDGKDVATLSVSDTNANADAKSKFDGAKEKLGEWPMMTVGKNQTTVLAKNRWQVKVSSQTLDHDARKGILGKFDLKQLP